MSWVRDGEQPKYQTISFQVSSEKHPELAKWIWGLPYRQASKMIRDVLEAAVKMAEAMPDQKMLAPNALPVSGQGDQVPEKTSGVVPSDIQPVSNVNVSSAAAEIISRFDGMFPGVKK